VFVDPEMDSTILEIALFIFPDFFKKPLSLHSNALCEHQQ